MGSSAGGSGIAPHGHEEIVEFGRARRRPRGLGSTVLAVLAAAAVLAVVLHSSGHPHRPSPPAVAVTNVGHPILGVRTGWELFGLDRSGVVAVQFSRGRITRTALPAPESGGPVSVIVEPGMVIVRPLDNVPGYVVPDGQPARQLTGVLSHGALLLPGPATAQAWDIRNGHAISLVGARGRPLRARLAATPSQFPAQSGMADGRGGVLMVGVGGREYDAGPGILRPVGALVVAVGPVDWLGLSCDQRGACQNVVITAATGARRQLPGPTFSGLTWPWLDPAGAVAPDGSTAAVLVNGTYGTTVLDLINLTSGAETAVQVPVASHASGQTLAWSPDSRWLFVITATGHLDAVNPVTGRAQNLGLGLSGLSQIAIRGR